MSNNNQNNENQNEETTPINNDNVPKNDVQEINIEEIRKQFEDLKKELINTKTTNDELTNFFKSLSSNGEISKQKEEEIINEYEKKNINGLGRSITDYKKK